MIGKQLEPVLIEIEKTLWEFEFNSGTQPNYSLEGFKASLKIFSSVLMDKMWDLQESEDMSIENRKAMALTFGNDLRKLIKTFTNIDTVELYK